MKQDRLLHKVSMICFAILSLSFLLMAPLPGDIQSWGMDILAGASFWLSLAAGLGCQGLLGIRRRKWEKRVEAEVPGRIGLISFCKNPQGRLADLFLLVSVLGFALAMWLTRSQGFICYVFLGCTVLAFFAHCVYNGRNYNYLQIRKKRKSGRRARQRGIYDEKQQNHT